MKKVILGLISLFTGSSTAYGQDSYQIKVSQLNFLGFNSQVIFEQFQLQHGIRLDLNENLKVTESQEGGHIDFETFDQLSIKVTASAATGPYNKW